jgi:hypothetical protein
MNWQISIKHNKLRCPKKQLSYRLGDEKKFIFLSFRVNNSTPVLLVQKQGGHLHLQFPQLFRDFKAERFLHFFGRVRQRQSVQLAAKRLSTHWTWHLSAKKQSSDEMALLHTTE